MDKKLNILVISYLYPNKIYPDSGIFVHNRVKAVSKFCQITVINPIPWFPFSYLFGRYKNYNRIPLKETLDGIDIHHPKFFIIPGIFKWIDCFSFFASVFTITFSFRKKIDLIDLHWTYPDLLTGLILSKMFKKKFLVTVRGKEALNRFQDAGSGKVRQEYSVRNLITNYCLKKADHVITLSRELKDLCCRKGINPQHASMITNGIESGKFHYIDRDKARSYLGLSTDEMIILGVGSLNYGKGFDRVIRCLPELSTQFTNVVYYIVGSEGAAGFYKEELVRLSRKKGAKSRIKFIGQVPNPDLIYWYNAADVFCLSSRSEGSPNVLFEALACGCPSVATKVGAVPEIMVSDQQGKIVPNQEGRVISDGLMTVLSRAFNRKNIAGLMKGRTWEKCGKQVISIYNKLLND